MSIDLAGLVNDLVQSSALRNLAGLDAASFSLDGVSLSTVAPSETDKAPLTTQSPLILDLLDRWGTGRSPEALRLALQLQRVGIDEPSMLMSMPLSDALDVLQKLTGTRFDFTAPIGTLGDARPAQTSEAAAGSATLEQQPVGSEASLATSLAALRQHLLENGPSQPLDGFALADPARVGAGPHNKVDAYHALLQTLDNLAALQRETASPLPALESFLQLRGVADPESLLASPVAHALDLLQAEAGDGSLFRDVVGLLKTYGSAGRDERISIRQELQQYGAFGSLADTLERPLGSVLGMIKQLITGERADDTGEGRGHPHGELLALLNVLEHWGTSRPDVRTDLLRRIKLEGVDNPDAVLAGPLKNFLSSLRERAASGSVMERLVMLLQRYKDADIDNRPDIRAKLETLGIYADPNDLLDMSVDEALDMMAVPSSFVRFRNLAASPLTFSERLGLLLDMWQTFGPQSRERAEAFAQIQALTQIRDAVEAQRFVIRALIDRDLHPLEELLRKAKEASPLAVTEAKGALDREWGVRDPLYLQNLLDTENFRRRLMEFVRAWHATAEEAMSRDNLRHQRLNEISAHVSGVLDAARFAERLGTQADLHTFTLMFRSYLMSLNPLTSFYARAFYATWGILDPERLAVLLGVQLPWSLHAPERPLLIKYRMRPRKWKPGSYYGYDDGEPEVMGSEFL